MSKDSFQVLPDRYGCLLQHKGGGRRLLSWQPVLISGMFAPPRMGRQSLGRPAVGPLSAIQPSPRWREKMLCERVRFRPTPQPVYCPAPATFPYPTLLYALSASLQFCPSGSVLSTIPLSLPPSLPHPSISPSTPSLPFSFPLCALDRLALIKLIAMVVHLNGSLSRHRLPPRRRRWLQHDGTSSKSPTSVQTE